MPLTDPDRLVVVLPHDIKEEAKKLAEKDDRKLSAWARRVLIREIENARDDSNDLPVSA